MAEADNKENKKPKKKWTTNSVHGGLLFILFQDRIYHPDSYSASQIFKDERLPFKDLYSNKNFSTYCQTASNKCNKFQRHGTGLTEEFQECVAKARVEYESLLDYLKGHSGVPPSYDEDDDDTYVCSEEEDVSHDGDEDEDDSLSELVQNASLDPRQMRTEAEIQDKKAKKKEKEARSKKKSSHKADMVPAKPTVSPSNSSRKKTPKDTKVETPIAPVEHQSKWSSVEQQNTPTKSLVMLQDDRLHCMWKLAAEFDGDIYLSDKQDKILQDTYYSEDYFDAQKLMGLTGIDDANNIFQNALQLGRDSLKNQLLAKPMSKLLSSGDVVVTDIVFYLPYPVEPQLRNFDGGEETEVPVDILDTGDWASVVLHKKNVDTAVLRPRINRRKAPVQN